MSSIEETDNTFIKNGKVYFQYQPSLLLKRHPRERGDPAEHEILISLAMFVLT